MVKQLAKALRLAHMKRRILKSGLFDPDFYLSAYPDVAASGQDPLDHFARNGGREARSPSRDFDGPVYVMSNPAARLAENIVIDWLDEGRKGKRQPPCPLAAREANLAPHVFDASTTGGTAVELVPPLRVSRRDYAIARKSGLFDEGYYRSAYGDELQKGTDPLRHYLERGWRENRNPSAQFDTHYVATTIMGCESEQTPVANPLLHYLAHRNTLRMSPVPPGAIVLERPNQPSAGKSCRRIAIQIHLHYTEMIQDFLPYLQRFPLQFDLLLSTSSEADARFLRNFVATHISQRKAVVRVTPNRGRDLAPFLLGFRDLLASYDYVCHLHSKRSPHTHFGRAWLDWVLRSMFGEDWIGQAVIEHLEANPDCMMMFPDNYHAIKKFAGWAGNEASLRAVLDRFGRAQTSLPLFANFAAGSMAWYRGEFIQKLASGLSLENFEEEDGQLEGTLAHVLERAIPLAAGASGENVCRYYLKTIPAALIAETYHGASPQSEPVGKAWPRDTSRIARQRPLPLAPLSRVYDPERLQLSWVIPDFSQGAGGHMTIFRIIQFLEAFGHEQTIWIQNAYNHRDPASAKALINRHYRKLGPRVHVRFLPDDVRQLSGDAIIATDCWTAFPVSRATNFKERFYFIQDFEPQFHPMGESYLIAEGTYSLGFAALCAGDWLLSKAREYGMWARSWSLAADTQSYYPASLPRNAGVGEPKRIAFYGRSYTPRRAVGLGLAAFEELARRRNDFVVQMFGEDGSGKDYNFPHEQKGILDPDGLAELYRNSDVGVSFSTTNYSLVPLEMMACGLAVVEIDTPSARAAFPQETVTFAAPSPTSVADAIEGLLDNADQRGNQIAASQAFVKSLNWESSARMIENAIRERLFHTGCQAIDPRALAPALHLRGRKASVVIPTYNGGDLFRRVLEASANQATDFDYDVLVIDSSSTDGTGEFAARFGGRVRCEVIDQRDFQHGRTRNNAIGLTDGEVVAILTQDAMPQDRHWLGALVAPFSIAGVAGAIGRHRAYPEHNGLVARDLDLMFDRFRDLGPIFCFGEGLPSFLRPGSVDWRMMLHFYSDNNSAMRRTVWEKLPYPEVDWGEDQIWCWEMLKLGLAKAYADKAVVWHSHDLGEAEQVKVGACEGRMFAEHFGYHLAEHDFEPAHLAHIRNEAMLHARRRGLPVSDVEAYVRMLTWSQKGRALGTAQAGLAP
jgi:glycosyltransferase involved in cell wall biosynthesis/GT2 family glycosyltransferase